MWAIAINKPEFIHASLEEQHASGMASLQDACYSHSLFNRRTSQSQKETHSVLPYAVYVVQQ